MILSAQNAQSPGLTVVTRASEEDAEEKLRRAGADTVFFALQHHRGTGSHRR